MGQVISGFVHTRLSKQLALALVLCTLGAGVFLFVRPAFAANIISDAFFWAVGRIIEVIIGVLGTFLINLFYVLISVAKYNEFLGSTAVNEGWVVVRDVVNMFFVLVLLAIAIGTILQQQQYHYSQTLPKFLAAAILVNFSKTICGIMIDFAQVVMMTFAGAIANAAGGNLAALVGIPGLLKQVNPLRVGGEGAVNAAQGSAAMDIQAFGGFFMALIFVVVAMIVVGIMVVMLVIRIVALWFLIILSPAVFFLMALPQDRGYSSKWWDQFINYLLVGPVMMFFLWLSLTVVANQNGQDATQIAIATELGINFIGKEGGYPIIGDDLLGRTAISTIGGIAGYILGICMLIATLMAAQQLSSVGGNIAGAGAGYIKDWLFAGKRGPFNPVRYLREGVGGVMARREERRKERVQERVRKWDRAVGIAQGAPAELARTIGRGALATGPGRRVRQWYQSEGTQHALDSGFRFMGGWGERRKRRHAEYRSRHENNITQGDLDVGRLSNQAHAEDERSAQLLTHAADMEQQAENIRQHGLQSGLTQDEVNRRADMMENSAQTARGSAEAARNTAINHRQAAEFRQNQVNQSKMALIGNTALEGVRGFVREGTRIMLAGALTVPTGGASVLAAYAPRMLDDLRKSGAQHALLSENEQGTKDAEGAKKYTEMTKDQRAGALAGTIPGHDTNAAKRQILLAGLQKGDYGETDVPQLREDMHRYGADPGSMKQFEANVLTKYPLQSLLMNDAERMQEGVEDEKIKGKSINQDLLQATPHMANILVEALSNITEGKDAHKFISEMTDPTRQELAQTARNRLAEPGQRNNDGTLTREGAQTFRTYLQAGGQFDQFLPGAQLDRGDLGTQENRNLFNQVLNDSALRTTALMALPSNTYRSENVGSEIVRAIANLPDEVMGNTIESMRGTFANATRDQRRQGRSALGAIAEYGDRVVPTERLTQQRDTANEAFNQRQREWTEAEQSVTDRRTEHGTAQGNHDSAINDLERNPTDVRLQANVRRTEQLLSQAEQALRAAEGARNQAQSAVTAAQTARADATRAYFQRAAQEQAGTAPPQISEDNRRTAHNIATRLVTYS